MPKLAYKDLNFGEKKLATIQTADQIIRDYRAQGYTLTLRQLYYQFVARGLIENSERSYKNLGTAISDARDAGMIDWFGIEDRGRGIKPWLIEEDELEVLNGIEVRLAMDFWKPQDTYVEVWVEKEALASVVQRPCERWRVPYMPCKGYLSASEAWRSGQRFEAMQDEGRRCVLIHLGDHDPSGIDMTRDNADRVRLYSGGADVEVRRIALNMDQVEEHRPPPNPAKITDSRSDDYIDRFGRTSWELDALEPRFLDKLISDEIATLVDLDIWQQTLDEEDERRSVLAKLHGHWDEVREFASNLE